MNPTFLKGKKVVGTEGYMLGEVDSLDIDLTTWQADAFYVSLSDEAIVDLGFKKTFQHKVIVCLPTQLIKSVGDIVILKESIKNAEDVAEKGVGTISTKLEGKKVVGSNGYLVGDFEGLDIDVDSWQVTGLQVSLADGVATELGFKRPFLSKVVVIIPSRIVRLIGNFITLDKDIKNLESLVECIRNC